MGNIATRLALTVAIRNMTWVSFSVSFSVAIIRNPYKGNLGEIFISVHNSMLQFFTVGETAVQVC